MRQGPNGRRPRGRHHSGGSNGGGGGSGSGHNGNHSGGGNPRSIDNRPRSAASLRHQTFDSNCIEVRVRGNAWQVHEKYQALARDAQSAGDRVAAEHYLQHAEHYFRIIEAINEATAAEQVARPNSGQPQQGNFGEQPQIPNNYYGGANPAQQQTPGGAPAGQTDVNGNVTPMPPAEVSARGVVPQQPVPTPGPFFTPEEMDEQGNPAAVAGRR